MNPILNERLVAVAQQARAAKHGNKGIIYDAACRELGLSYTTLLKKLKTVVSRPSRKQRKDAGNSTLTRDEAMLISALLLASARKNGKRLYAIGDAVEVLRANGLIRAASIDPTTGALHTLSVSAIQRALYRYGLHPDQLLAPAPVTELASLHANHVWQIDASLCVLYYLRPSDKLLAHGLQVMDHTEFYKNKPRNLARIANDRVWSYEITDHASGWLYTEYVMGGESSENLCSVLINAMQERGDADLMHGVPRILMMDAGSANTSAMMRNLCRALGIEILIHAVGNARAVGQVENARNLIERKFEPGLRFVAVNNLSELNAMAKKWRMHFNATAQHHRHGRTRSQMWMTIRAEQLIKAPPIEVCRTLAIAHPESRKVSPKLRVSFAGREYDVSTVPKVMVGEKLLLTHNPWSHENAQVVGIDKEGNQFFHVVNEVKKNQLGFSMDAALIGQAFKMHAPTPAQTAYKEIMQRVTDADSVNGKVKANAHGRKAQLTPFAGKIDPYKHIDNALLPTYLPRRGTLHHLVPASLPCGATPLLSHVAAAKQLKASLTARGKDWLASYFQWLTQRFPKGVPQEQLDAIEASLIKITPTIERSIETLLLAQQPLAHCA